MSDNAMVPTDPKQALAAGQKLTPEMIQALKYQSGVAPQQRLPRSPNFKVQHKDGDIPLSHFVVYETKEVEKEDGTIDDEKVTHDLGKEVTCTILRIRKFMQWREELSEEEYEAGKKGKEFRTTTFIDYGETMDLKEDGVTIATGITRQECQEIVRAKTRTEEEKPMKCVNLAHIALVLDKELRVATAYFKGMNFVPVNDFLSGLENPCFFYKIKITKHQENVVRSGKSIDVDIADFAVVEEHTPENINKMYQLSEEVGAAADLISEEHERIAKEKREKSAPKDFATANAEPTSGKHPDVVAAEANLKQQQEAKAETPAPEAKPDAAPNVPEVNYNQSEISVEDLPF